jgi:hypothetical protein
MFPSKVPQRDNGKEDGEGGINDIRPHTNFLLHFPSLFSFTFLLSFTFPHLSSFAFLPPFLHFPSSSVPHLPFPTFLSFFIFLTPTTFLPSFLPPFLPSFLSSFLSFFQGLKSTSYQRVPGVKGNTKKKDALLPEPGDVWILRQSTAKSSWYVI